MSIYNTLPINALNNITKHHMDDLEKKYNTGDIIFYSGKCHHYSKFYATIDKISKSGMNITLLELEYDENNVHFYKTESQLKGLTRRPFYLLNFK